MPIEDLMWVEKYRPTTLDDLAGQDTIKQRLRALLQKKEQLPHLLFAGPPGSGKTTTATLVAKEILGDQWRDYTLSLNASDERGIDVVRERIKTFARYADRREGVPFRLVILDESDEMCLDPSTKVLVGKLESLEEITLRDLYVRNGVCPFSLPSFGERGHRLEDDTGKIILSGTADLYRITLEDGRTITASAGHPFFEIRGSLVRTVRTKELMVGSEVADFSKKILRCYGCSRPFFRANQWEGYAHHFCSTVCRNEYFASLPSRRSRDERRAISMAALASYGPRGFQGEVESKMARLLDTWGIKHTRERIILATPHGREYPLSVDFMVGRIAIFVNGCWWHVCPRCGVQPKHEKQKLNMQNDLRHYKELERLGYRVVVVWEHELNDPSITAEDVLPRIFHMVGVSGGHLPKVRHARVKTVDYLGPSAVLNISVKRNRNFLLANGILTHNTSDGQTALRRIMEENSAHTRFILICNYSSGIIEPLQSRCAIFRFQRLDEASVTESLKEIAKKERLKHAGDSVFGEIYGATQGDLRQAINLLQAASASGDVTMDSVKSVSGAAAKARITEIVKTALDGDFEAARSKMVELTRVYGVPERDFLKFANESLGGLEVPDMAKVISILAEYDFRLVQGSQPELQLTAMLAQLSFLKKKAH